MKNLKLLIYILFIFGLSGCGVYNFNSMPEGTDYNSKQCYVNDDEIDFMFDLTYESDGERISEQEIFDTIFSHILEAERYILIDMFLFNSYAGSADQSYRDITGELTNLLIYKAENSSVQVDFITDPINNIYGGLKSPELERMKAAGINVIITDIDKLPDSNKIYSPIWRTLFQWFPNHSEGGFLPNPFSADAEGVTFLTYLKLLNFKANHRKSFIADYEQSWISIVSSANPHNGSSAHSNVAVTVFGSFASEIYQAEQAVATFSNSSLTPIQFPKPDSTGSIKLQLVTENRIKKSLIAEIENSYAGDSIHIGMFYLSDRDVIEQLLESEARGVSIQLILDPNKDAFGKKKNGIPNRQVANELHRESGNNIEIKWYNTSGEQYHSKFVFIDRANSESSLIIGSANLTKRNIGNYNLEMDVLINMSNKTVLYHDLKGYYNRVWNNPEQCLDYQAYESRSFLKNLMYRFFEAFGANTF